MHAHSTDRRGFEEEEEAEFEVSVLYATAVYLDRAQASSVNHLGGVTVLLLLEINRWIDPTIAASEPGDRFFLFSYEAWPGRGWWKARALCA